MVTLRVGVERKLPVLLTDNGGALQTGIAEGDVTVQISKNLAALSAFTLTGKWSEVGLGIYAISFAAGDLDTEGFFTYTVTVAGCEQYTGLVYIGDLAEKTELESAISTTESNIRGADSDDLKTLSEQIDAVQTDTTAIKAKTDNLPDDPADESSIQGGIVDARDAIIGNETTMEANLVADISEAEANIRGVHGDDLDFLSGQLDTLLDALIAIKGVGWTDENLTTIDSLIDAIKAKTDNLPADPADESLLEAAITVVDDNLASLAVDIVTALSADITTAQTAIETILTAIKGDGWTMESLEAIFALIDSDVMNNLTILQNAITASQNDLTYLKQKESGRWKIVNAQLIYYENDGVTPLRTFNLFNSQGEPTSENPYERVPV
jgi:hypothetical protein